MLTESVYENVVVVAAGEILNGFGAAGYAEDAPTALINYGHISEITAPEAIYLDGFYAGFEIDNYGTISEGGYAMHARYAPVHLNNYGEIYGDFYLESSPIVVVNSGVIEGQIYATDILILGPVKIENSGLISSPDSYAVISGGRFIRDVIENSGVVEGDIYTWGGSDWVFNDAGTIDGTVYLGDGHDIYRAVEGVVTGDVLGQNGNDELTGGNSDDRLSGGIGRDVIDGGAGNDHLMGGRHFDILTGGEGRDVFEFQRGYGGEHINDFENNRDTLLLDEGIWGGGLRPAQLLERFGSTTDGVTQIDFGGRDVITLDGIDDYRLLANDIVFG